ncbi:MAG: hypothetical protein F4X80_06260 [Chloroflexi bacterium]|nr:hypothetical protein [Chloroflexota bacterium]
MGASALVIAAAFAVAFAVLISSSTPTEATIQTAADGTGSDTSADANNGDTLYILNSFDTGYVRFEINTTGAASARFTHDDASDDGQSILCRSSTNDPPNTCDADEQSGVTVALKIDDDSGKGVVFVKQTTIPASGDGAVTTDTISVTVAQVPSNISVTASPKSVNSGQGGATADPTTLSIRLTDTDGRGIAAESLTVIASHGTLTAATAQPAAWANRDVEDTTDATADPPDYDGLSFTGGGSQVGTLITSSDNGVTAADGAGFAAVTLTGGGAPGIATITVRQTNGAVVGTGEVVLFGPAKTITAEAEKSAIAIGESTFIVVTVTDAGGNAVANASARVKTRGIAAPTKLDTPVGQSLDVNKDVDGDGVNDGRDGDIPSCDETLAAVAESDQTDGEPPLRFASTGTNRDGQCVIQITATDDTSSLNNDAARGEHTITIVGGNDADVDPKAIDAVTVVIQVGGPPATITSDAPARIDASEEITINVTVHDDEDVRVGAVTIKVDQTAGDGKIITDAAPSTKDGRAKFTYLAPSTPGVAEFLVRTKDAKGKVTASLPIIVNIGAEAVEAPPEAPSLSRAPSATGFTLVTFSGGSVDDLSTALTDACGDGVRAWATDYQGNYVSFFPSAPAVVNSGFNALFSDGVPANEPLLVGNCGG